MKAIHKYPLEIMDRNTVSMPLGAEILTVQVQRNQPCLWALVETDNPMKNRHIATYGTGHSVDDGNGTYIGTYQMAEGSLVFHVFDLT